MANKLQYKSSDFIDAIPGSGGVITVIAARVGCGWETVKKYISRMPSVKAAYDAECEAMKDLAESVVMNNIRLADRYQRERQMQADSADAKWFLARKAKDRGYTVRDEISGPDGEPIVFRYTGNVDPDDL